MERFIEAILGLVVIMVLVQGFAALHGLNDGRVQSAVQGLAQVNKGGVK